MEKNGLKINILTPAGQVYSENITSCMIPGVEGQFQVLENHAALLSIVEIGPIKIIDENAKAVYFATSGGMCEVIDNNINLVVESAELSTQIDVKRAEESKSRAEKRIAQKSGDINAQRAKISLLRAVNRLKVAQIR
jgi:F-type H+-transporting ATPase subunit epsilon